MCSNVACLLAGVLVLGLFQCNRASAAGDDDPEELVNFAFARYLGTGYYSTDDSSVFVIQLPFARELRPMSPNEFGLVLRYPLTIGLTDFDISRERVAGEQELSAVPDIDDVATLSLVPGLEFHYPLRDNWYVAPFVDIGIAQDLNSDSTSQLFGLGLKSLAEFSHGDDLVTLGNRLLYAGQNNRDGADGSSFAVLQTGLDYRFGSANTRDSRPLNASLYYVFNYYLNDFAVPRTLETTIRFSNTHELGFTFNLPALAWLPEDPRLGFGVQFVDGVEIYRIVFGTPFF